MAAASLLSAYSAYEAALHASPEGTTTATITVTGEAKGSLTPTLTLTLSLTSVVFQSIMSSHVSLSHWKDSLAPRLTKLVLLPKKFVNQLTYTVRAVGSPAAIDSLKAAVQAIRVATSGGGGGDGDQLAPAEEFCIMCSDPFCCDVDMAQGTQPLGCAAGCSLHTGLTEDGGDKSCAERMMEMSLDPDSARYGKVSCACLSPVTPALLSIDEIVAIVGEQQLTQHIGVARHFFAIRNRSKWVACPSNETTCKMLFRARGRDESFSGMTCPGCSARFCVACLSITGGGVVSEPHPDGLSCAEHLGALDATGGVGDALRGLDPNYFGECPQCHTLVERANGCSHLHCTQCGHSFYLQGV